ncbi:hypothetical protein psal_cds_553 [Pandoravirus salinus]|uniref:Uncharacterized protein n=1 Tax=Pandoravirus salinus TaxID=1349410 RepID=S4W1T7_9VIRU|nr:hypothetical protein psal_cds_553 [Pandoravirus salinus]AGO84397.1 hypothetical protein psal_cds_553 [Pandoravirus salinus]
MNLFSVLDVDFEFTPPDLPAHKHSLRYYETGKWSISNNWREPNNTFLRNYTVYCDTLQEAVHTFFDLLRADPYASRTKLKGSVRAWSDTGRENSGRWSRPKDDDFVWHEEMAGLLYSILCRTGGFRGAYLACEEILGMTREDLAAALDSAIKSYRAKNHL